MDGNGERLLEEEARYYNRHRKELLSRYFGRYLLIKGKAVIGSFGTHEQAVAEGVRRFGREPFMVRLAGEGELVADIPALRLGLIVGACLGLYCGG